MFKAVLKKNRDGGKGSKKDSGLCNIRKKNQMGCQEMDTPNPPAQRLIPPSVFKSSFLTKPDKVSFMGTVHAKDSEFERMK